MIAAKFRIAVALGVAAGALVPMQGAQAAGSCVGTQVKAGANLQTAVSAAREGATLCLAAGVYRVSSPVVPKRGMTLWGAGGDRFGTRIEGSVPLSGWARSGATWYVSGKLPAAYSGNGACEDTTRNPCRLAEQVFRGGNRIKRVLSASAVVPGTFFADYRANRIYVGDNPATNSFEVARTAYGIRSSATGVTIRDLRVQEFATPGQQGTVTILGSDWRMTHTVVQNNHAVGIFMSRAHRTVLINNRVNGNGQLGISQHASQSVRVLFNEIAGNNTDGFWMADWESGGYKATESSAEIRGNNVHDNLGVGVWADIDVKGMTISYNTIRANVADGVRYEISYDGSIHHNTVVGNGFNRGRGSGTSLYYGAGINSNTSSNMDIYANTLINNVNGIGLQARNRGSGVYGTWRLVNNRVHDNTVTQTVGASYGQGVTGLVQNTGDTTYFTSKGNTFRNNDYRLDAASARRFAWQNDYIAKDQWRAAGQDTAGQFTIG